MTNTNNEILREILKFIKRNHMSRRKFSLSVTGGRDHTVVYRLENGTKILTSTLDAIINFMDKYEGKK